MLPNESLHPDRGPIAVWSKQQSSVWAAAGDR